MLGFCFFTQVDFLRETVLAGQSMTTFAPARRTSFTKLLTSSRSWRDNLK